MGKNALVSRVNRIAAIRARVHYEAARVAVADAARQALARGVDLEVALAELEHDARDKAQQAEAGRVRRPLG